VVNAEHSGLKKALLGFVRQVNSVASSDHHLAEYRRVLSANGTLVVTAPMHWRLHEAPCDFLRFTRFGRTRLLEKHGFAIKNLEPCGGVYVLIGQIFLDHLAERGRQRAYRVSRRKLDRSVPGSEISLHGGQAQLAMSRIKGSVSDHRLHYASDLQTNNIFLRFHGRTPTVDSDPFNDILRGCRITVFDCAIEPFRIKDGVSVRLPSMARKRMR
jgi:hypothetical protein